MTALTIPIKREECKPIFENQQGIENHTMAAIFYDEVAKNHREAAKHHAAGKHDEAFKSICTAQENLSKAAEYQSQAVLNHVMNNYKWMQ
ncbi:MAG: hypothetical protein NTX03_05750 [Bacteroidetes bacterium]|nr:hypothetical protein [Bacteroidota bacterium]